jgi:hypothetical protein
VTAPAAYRQVVFYTASDDYAHDGTPQTPVAEWMDNGWQGDDSLVDYLAEYDQDGGGDIVDSPPWGTSDDVFAHGPYLVSTNARLGYVALCQPLDSTGEPIAPRDPART